MIERPDVQHHELIVFIESCICAEYEDMDTHSQLCQSVKISCPNLCHTKEVVECTYSAVGYEVESFRKDHPEACCGMLQDVSVKPI